MIEWLTKGLAVVFEMLTPPHQTIELIIEGAQDVASVVDQFDIPFAAFEAILPKKLLLTMVGLQSSPLNETFRIAPPLPAALL
ncbi:MAG TPA: hypothetical protein P5550_04745 [Bacteroidales bacterium]|nr:hypothetical protein [Bacteroidales bacterium]